MKKRITKKAARELYPHMISVGYCNLQFLLKGTDPVFYSTRREGWACDYYELPGDLCVSTGYSPIGRKVSYDLCRAYDEKAEAVFRETYDWDDIKGKLSELLEDFAEDVEREVFA